VELKLFNRLLVIALGAKGFQENWTPKANDLLKYAVKVSKMFDTSLNGTSLTSYGNATTVILLNVYPVLKTK